MAEAHAAGIPTPEFWNSTYREIFNAISGDAVRRRRDRQAIMWGAWHGAAFERSKRMPNLGTLLAKMEPKREMSSRELRASILGIAKAMNAETVYRKRGEA
jgi:hypothetical protein